MKKYEVLAGKPLDEYLGVTVMIDLRVKFRNDRLELATKDMTYPQVRQEVMIFTERRRDTFEKPRPWALSTTKTNIQTPTPVGMAVLRAIGSEEKECREDRDFDICQVTSHWDRGQGKGMGPSSGKSPWGEGRQEWLAERKG